MADEKSELEKVEVVRPKLSIGGRQREIRFNFSAWAEIEKKYGSIKNFAQIEKDVQQKPFETIPELIYIGLVDKEGVTKDNCLDDYSMADMEEVAKVLQVALYGSLPKDESKKK